MLKWFLITLSLLVPQLQAASAWDRPSMREPFIDGVEAMLDSMRKNPPYKDPGYGYGSRLGRLNWFGYNPSPFPSDDPWLDEMPLGNQEDSPFFRISPMAQIRGRWLGQFGDGLWIKSGWIR